MLFGSLAIWGLDAVALGYRRFSRTTGAPR